MKDLIKNIIHNLKNMKRLDKYILKQVIEIAERNINNLIYADDTTLMAESEEELKSFVTEDERRGRIYCEGLF